ncbi:MAG: hypothetical protein IJ615_07555 [Bacteroidaceae bacterium]|nr:hypothetical protein [Bacteroidaceae bacterium]
MKQTILLICALALSAALAAQPHRGKFNPEEFKAKLENFITAETGFTPAEAQAFYPIYHEMKEKQRNLQREIFRLKKDAPDSNASDKDFALVIQKIKDLGAEMAGLEVTYYKKMCKAVSPRKVYAAMQAEDKFHRQMLEEFGHNNPHAKGHGQRHKNE